MKFVVISEPSGGSMEAIMAKFSRYTVVVDAFVARAEHRLRQLPGGKHSAPTFAHLFENAPFPESCEMPERW